MQISKPVNDLFNLTRVCLNNRCSPDAQIRRDALELLPADMVLASSAEEAYRDCRERFRLLLRDLCDYGMRRDYVFARQMRTAEEQKELGWLEGHFEGLLPPRQKKAAPGRSEVVSSPFEPHRQRRSLGDCVVALVDGLAADNVPMWLVRWLCLDMGYNLDWLIFGLGPMFAEWAPDSGVAHSLPPTGTVLEPGTGKIRYEDVTSLRERQAMSLWSFTEWQWLHNLRAVVKSVYKPPTIPLLSRLTAWWRVPSQLPQMPHILAWIDWISVWCAHEFLEGEPAPGWKQTIVEQLVMTRNTALLLLGLGGQAGAQYRSSKAEPTTCVLRLAWMVRMAIERRGRQGFLDYLDLVDDEARARGFDCLTDIFRQRTWSSSERPFRKSASTRPDEVDARDMADRNVPWGVPAQADLKPLELLKLVARGGIPCDPDEHICWIPAAGSAPPQGITPNPRASAGDDAGKAHEGAVPLTREEEHGA